MQLPIKRYADCDLSLCMIVTKKTPSNLFLHFLLFRHKNQFHISIVLRCCCCGFYGYNTLSYYETETTFQTNKNVEIDDAAD